MHGYMPETCVHVHCSRIELDSLCNRYCRLSDLLLYAPDGTLWFAPTLTSAGV